MGSATEDRLSSRNNFGKRSFRRRPETRAQCQTTYSKTPDRTGRYTESWAYCTSNPSQTCLWLYRKHRELREVPTVGLQSTLFSPGHPLPHQMSDSSCCSSRLTVAQRAFLQVHVHGKALTWNPQLVLRATLHALSCLNRKYFPTGMF